MNIRIASSLAVLVLLASLGPANAAGYVGENEIPRPIDVARALAGDQFKPHLRKRGIALDETSPPATAAAAPAASGDSSSEGGSGGTLDVAIGFALGSAALRPHACAQLDAIAEGLKLLDPAATIVIGGHTDATGTPAFNDVLSLRRAEAVKVYLEQHHGIAASRLQTHGLGQRVPLDGTGPYDPRNRRVQFRIG